MSGITGIWKLDGDPVDRPEIKRFNDTLMPRGRDRSGIYIDDSRSLALGHRCYLLPGASVRVDHPLSYAGRYWITYDGDIYNLTPLRAQLQQLGYHLDSGEDAEVVLAAYLQWGPDCQLRFNGKWAFAIWDEQERCLFLARDRFGEKPLYYCQFGHRFAFASELKAFLALPWLDTSFDPVYLTTAIRARFDLNSLPETFLQHVRQLQVGYCLTIDQIGGFKLDRWWCTVDHLETPLNNFDQQVKRFQELFADACAIRVQDSRTAGVALSGGLDSTSILATIVQPYNNCSINDMPRVEAVDLPFHAYVINPDDPSRDESALANALIRQTGISAHYEPFLFPTESTELDEMLFEQENIGIVPEAVTIAQAMVRDGMAYAITGDGPDHLFGAMLAGINVATAESLLGHRKLSRMAEMLKLRQSRLTEIGQTRLTQRLRVLGYSMVPIMKYLIKGRAGFRPDRIRFYGKDDFFNYPVMSVNFVDFNQDCRQFGQNELLTKTRYFFIHFGSITSVWHRKDRISMNRGLEWRAPFMDWRLVCFALSLSSHSVIREGYTKPVIRKAMRGMLPDEIRTRKSKMALIGPENEGFMKTKNIVLDTIHERFFLDSELWQGPVLAAQIEQAYKEHDYRKVTMLWHCVTAARLQQTFTAKRHEYLSAGE